MCGKYEQPKDYKYYTERAVNSINPIKGGNTYNEEKAE